jgi:hypothetical protein
LDYKPPSLGIAAAISEVDWRAFASFDDFRGFTGLHQSSALDISLAFGKKSALRRKGVPHGPSTAG